MTLPNFLRSPDPDHTPATHAEWLSRAAYAYPHRDHDDRPFTLNYGYGQQVFDVDTALAWAERLADEQLRGAS